jgi:hypothetical protein
MKTKKTLTKELVLNKKTIATLTGEEMRRPRGDDPTKYDSICRTDCLSCIDTCDTGETGGG